MSLFLYRFIWMLTADLLTDHRWRLLPPGLLVASSSLVEATGTTWGPYPSLFHPGRRCWPLHPLMVNAGFFLLDHSMPPWVSVCTPPAHCASSPSAPTSLVPSPSPPPPQPFRSSTGAHGEPVRSSPLGSCRASTSSDPSSVVEAPTAAPSHKRSRWPRSSWRRDKRRGWHVGPICIFL